MCAGSFSIPERMNTVPISTARIAPIELKAWARLIRRSAESSGPNSTTKLLAPVSRKASPEATMNRASRNIQYRSMMAAGQNSRHPKLKRNRPSTNPVL
jgi:hypothetical protein